MRIRFLIPLFLISSVNLFGQWHLSSPNGELKLTANLSASNELFYKIDYNNNGTVTSIIQDSYLGLLRNDCDFRNGLTYVSADSSIINEDYTLKTGKKLNVHNEAKELGLNFQKCGVNFRVIFRAFDDGIAFRYKFPDTSAVSFTSDSERTEMKMAATGGMALLQPNSIEYPAYEKIFQEKLVGDNAPDSFGWTFPALMNVNNYWVYLTEAELDTNYFASHLSPIASNGLYTYAKPSSDNVIGFNDFATFKTPMNTPWRVIAIGKDLNTIVETDIVTDLSSPSVISNTDYIETGVATFSWWSAWSSSKYIDSMEHFVDLADDYDFKYFVIDAYWDEIANLNTAMPQFVSYADARNVKLWVWYNSGGPHNAASYANNIGPRGLMDDRNIRRAEFQRLKNWGIVGVKVDFFMSDKQGMIKQYIDILKDAADFELMVNFHGSTLPRGWNRTYPNLLSMEAVSGSENILFNQEDYRNIVARHNVNNVFTRNIVGSMDYTPGVISYEYFIDPITNPGRYIDHKSTVSHQLSLITLFESGIIHLADHHYHYEHLPALAKDMLRGIPTSWDETKFVEGYPSDYVVLARRKGLNWYISGINADINATQSITLNPTFASPGVYQFKAMKDGASKSDLDLTVGDYKTDSTISITMAPFGGFTYILEAKCLDVLNVSLTSEGASDLIYKAKGIKMTNEIKAPSKVTSSADNYVLMEAPFQVENGSVFKAEIGGCL